MILIKLSSSKLCSKLSCSDRLLLLIQNEDEHCEICELLLDGLVLVLVSQRMPLTSELGLCEKLLNDVDQWDG